MKSHLIVKSEGMEANVLHCEFELPDDFPDDLKQLIPNKFFFSDPKESRRRLKGIVAVSLRRLSAGEELLMDYRYAFSSSLPEWYIPLLQ